ncbi:ATP-binding cassette domain-containing protein [Paenibacillus alginolyticus]|uniref:ATP-binding cassette domain-containing protein n=1 Tax=Paenibacillus alginolyticus TaxID=59839 RepID=UPI00042864A5|nr:ATP-binding cassette domain-containing protein [Paenibacillus alginolyticus]MCY9670617.1 ATP-binding cassette domain-containing protein [Paenibacillus alginolyticus]
MIDDFAAIVMKNYSAGYRGKPILQGVNFQAELGQVIAVLGAGKTTLFRSIMQLLPKHAGQVQILGRTMERMSDQRWARSQIGYVPLT